MRARPSARSLGLHPDLVAPLHSPMRSNDPVIWDNIGVTHTNPAYERGADRTVWFFTVPSPHSPAFYA